MNVEVNGVCAYGGIGYAKLKLGVCMDVSVSVTIDEGIPIPCVVRHAANNEGLVILTFPLMETKNYHLSIVASCKSGLKSAKLKLSGRFLKWSARLGRYRIPRLYRILRDSDVFEREGEGRSEFIQVFDGGGSTVFRLHFEGERPIDASGLTVRNLKGRNVDCEPIVMERFPHADFPEWENSIVSIRLPIGLCGFIVEADGYPFAKMDKEKFDALSFARDLEMVNPGIDGLYHQWIEKQARQIDVNLINREIEAFGRKPLISIVTPLYHTPPRYLKDMMGSVLAQSYGNWELVLVNASPSDREMQSVLSRFDDERIKLHCLEENRGIAGNTNYGIGVSRGEYIAFLDHDDMLDPHALYEYVKCINANPSVAMLYCDEDSFRVSESDRFAPLFKPDFNLDLLYSHNYIVHFLMVARRVFSRIELSSDDVNGAQDYDLSLKAFECDSSVVHIPKVLYHWRVHPDSTNGGIMESKPYAEKAGALVLQNHFARRGIKTHTNMTDIPCVYRIDYDYDGFGASALVAKYANSGVLNACLCDIAGGGDGGRFVLGSLLLGDTVADVDLSHTQVSFVCAREKAGGYASSVYEAVSAARNELIVLVNESADIPEGFEIRRLLGYFAREEVGVVAPKMLYPDGLVQHAGLCIHEDGTIGYLNQNFTNHMGGGYHGTAECCCNYSAVSPDFLIFKKSQFEEVGGFDTYATSLVTTVDFCFKMRQLGKLCVVDPNVVATNWAPVLWPGRKDVRDSSLDEDLRALWSKWGSKFRRDVLYNPNVTIDNSYFRLRND